MMRSLCSLAEFHLGWKINLMLFPSLLLPPLLQSTGRWLFRRWALNSSDDCSRSRVKRGNDMFSLHHFWIDCLSTPKLSLYLFKINISRLVPILQSHLVNSIKSKNIDEIWFIDIRQIFLRLEEWHQRAVSFLKCLLKTDIFDFWFQTIENGKWKKRINFIATSHPSMRTTTVN